MYQTLSCPQTIFVVSESDVIEQAGDQLQMVSSIPGEVKKPDYMVNMCELKLSITILKGDVVYNCDVILLCARACTHAS